MKLMGNEEKSSGLTLTKPDIMRNIEEYASERFNAKLKLCLPKSTTQKKALHFIVVSPKTLDLFSLSEMSIYIQDKINFEDIYVQCKDYWTQEVFHDLFIDEVDYTVENKKGVEKFLDRNYPKLSNYQQQIKEHGLPFFEFEKMEREESEMLGKAIVETCQNEVDSHSPTKEEDIAALLTHIIRLAAKRGLDSNRIIEKIDISNLAQLVNK